MQSKGFFFYATNILAKKKLSFANNCKVQKAVRRLFCEKKELN